jgi:hypothetical protein
MPPEVGHGERTIRAGPKPVCAVIRAGPKPVCAVGIYDRTARLTVLPTIRSPAR